MSGLLLNVIAVLAGSGIAWVSTRSCVASSTSGSTVAPALSRSGSRRERSKRLTDSPARPFLFGRVGNPRAPSLAGDYVEPLVTVTVTVIAAVIGPVTVVATVVLVGVLLAVVGVCEARPYWVRQTGRARRQASEGFSS